MLRRGQLSMNGTSRVSREVQARFREGLGVKLPGATRPPYDEIRKPFGVTHSGIRLQLTRRRLGPNPPQDKLFIMREPKAISTSAKRELSTVLVGDGNRVWFPDMIEMLRSRWNELIEFPGPRHLPAGKPKGRWANRRIECNRAKSS